jgi:hypothetical protein
VERDAKERDAAHSEEMREARASAKERETASRQELERETAARRSVERRAGEMWDELEELKQRSSSSSPSEEEEDSEGDDGRALDKVGYGEYVTNNYSNHLLEQSKALDDSDDDDSSSGGSGGEDGGAEKCGVVCLFGCESRLEGRMFLWVC